MKSILIHLRASMKLLILLTIGFFIILGIVILLYKPMYEVNLNGEVIGYVEDKSTLQDKINQFMKSGDNDKVAFVEINELPQYELCLLKRNYINNIQNENEILGKIVNNGTSYYKFYAILNNSQEVMYVESEAQTEEIIETLKEKESTNIDNISYTVKYDTELKTFTGTEEAVATLYEEPVKEPVRTISPYRTSYSGSYGEDNEENSSYEQLGIALIRPITNYRQISSRFGSRGRGTHTGIDLAADYGSDIHAAADGVVTFSGGNPEKSYGYYIIIDHGNGVETLYAHCSSLYVQVGESVSQGETIAAVGSTGNSSGNHLHFEVRIDGVPRNPQNYVY